MVITDAPLETAREYLPARVFLIGAPSLALWRAATGTGVAVVNSPAAAAVKLGIQVRTKATVPQTGDAVQSVWTKTVTVGKETPERKQQPDTTTSSKTNKTQGYANNLPAPAKRATIIALYSLKGGVGKTTLSMNLAAVLRRQGYAVCLVDLDVKAGCTTDYLFPNSRPVVDMILWDDFPRGKTHDRVTVESFLATGPAGMFVLPSPEASYQAGAITNRLTETVLDVLSYHFDFIVVDMAGGALEHRERKALSMADVVFLLATPDEMSISGAVRTMDQVIGPGKPVDPLRVRFVVNRDRPRAPRRPEEVAKKVGLELGFVIPDDSPAIEEAAQNHTLPVLLKKESLFKESIENMALLLVPGFGTVIRTKEGFLSRLRGFFAKLFRKGEKRSEKSLAHAG
ncbi:AAA family ATPase [Desulfotomaculum copahuensis]|uniref:AAA domain-containing protein n=1 Tax=Desulfotomaculum copahuensis TaxID=1838280 RepID=A0A1B7LG65_9FIRM|nr:AAA family ATPase [Desulfotomaculum copahuensis]OAT83699.1 hypothetical protein A6M21_07635 [Desulfotomaculum copahuensis]